MVRSLNKKWKEFLFGFSGFGPNLLMVLMGAYYTDALDPAALENSEAFQAILPNVCFVLPVLFAVLGAVGKVFDGLIDIPFAYITDTLSTRWGRRRPAIAVCMLPMILSFAMCWLPIGGEGGRLINTIWCSLWSMVFFATYTMCMIAFYGSLSTVCTDEPQRLRVAGYKSFFDTISYCIVYALVPLILTGFELHINTFVFICLPLMLTIAIPLFLIKEGEKYGYPEREGESPERLSIGKSISVTMRNRVFLRWTLVNCCAFFGLQMFLSSMNGLIIGGMGFNGAEMALVNTCAFAPVPVMLYFFNKLKAKKGVRLAYQSCLLLFSVAILSFFFASRFLIDGNKMAQYVIAGVGGICGSWSIGVFFMMPYLAPSQISAVEIRLTGKNHSAMYFAANAVTTSIVGAISGSLVYELIKHIFFTKSGRFVWADTMETAVRELGASENLVYNFGNLLVPFVVLITCLIGFVLAFKLPRDFTAPILAREFKRMDPTLDISEIEREEEPAQEKGEIIFVQVGLSVLSGFIFGFIWSGLLMGSVRRLTGGFKRVMFWLVSALIPYGQLAATLAMRKHIIAEAQSCGIEMKVGVLPLVLPMIIFPILPLNLVALGYLQHKVNKLHEIKG